MSVKNIVQSSQSPNFQSDISSNSNNSYNADELLKMTVDAYGEYSMNNAIHKFGMSNASSSDKINALFKSVVYAESKVKDVNRFTANDVPRLHTLMTPYLEAESLEKLWAFLIKSAPPNLKALMHPVALGSDSLENGVIIRKFFDTHKLELMSVKELKLANLQLRIIPPEIRYFTGARMIDISGNQIEKLPIALFALKNLTKINARDNRLSLIPPEICQLTCLQQLQLSENNLESLPVEIGLLSKLQVLNLSANSLRSLPESISGLQSLIYFFLSENKLETLPESVGSLQNLVALHISNNKIALLPSSLCGLRHLQFLSLSFNHLQELPANLGQIKSLRSLFANNNVLKQLPQSLCELEELTHLSIDENPLHSLPNEMRRLVNLKHFQYGKHQLENWPEEIETIPYWSRIDGLYPRPEMNGASLYLNQSLTGFEYIYFKLGQKKWKECIDGTYHSYGPFVFDLGLHGGPVEPGYYSSMQKAFQFLGENPNRLIDPEFYLQLHQVACCHFKGASNATLMGLEKVGCFRGKDDPISAILKAPEYEVSSGGLAEFQSLNEKLSLMFGPTFKLGEMYKTCDSPRTIVIKYSPMSREKIRMIFNFFLTEFYFEVGHAENKNERLIAIGRLIQRLEWLHPTRDGCGRTDTALLNFLLTCYGLNPVLLNHPFLSSCKSLSEWVQALKEGMHAWEIECSS